MTGKKVLASYGVDLRQARGFKGLKQAIKLEFKMGKYDDACLAVLSRLVLTVIGHWTLPRAFDLCQVCRYPQLLGKVDQ